MHFNLINVLICSVAKQAEAPFTLTSSSFANEEPPDCQPPPGWSHVPPAQVLLPFQFTLKNSQREQSRHMGFSWEDEAGLGESLF